MRLIKWILFIGVLFIGWSLGWSNNSPIALHFLFWRTPEIPIYLLLLSIFFVGLIFGVLLGYFSRRTSSHKK